MKTKTTLLTFVLLMSVNLSAQKQFSSLAKRVSINVQSERLSKVLKQLELQGGFTMAYSGGTVDDTRLITLHAKSEPLSRVLDQIFKGTEVLYREMGDKVLLYAKEEGEMLITQTVRGTVIDPVSNQPIIGANVIIPASEPLMGASTDVFGRFRIEEVPVGRQNFQITFMGYKTKALSNVVVDAGKEVVLNIGLEESVTELEQIVVTANIDKSIPLNEMAMVSAKSFTVEETSKYAGSFNDPARMATSYAGVSGSSDDTDNSIIIRGNSPRGLLWRLEGLEIPNPNHFASDGASSGAISMLNSNVLANSDFMTGAFPAEYGNAFSGVFDLKLRNGNNENREYAIQAGLLGVDASFEGPLRRASNLNLPNASYLINYRYSTISMLESLGLNISDEGDRVPAFQDIAFKFHMPTQKLGTFSFYGLGGRSESLEANDITFLGQSYRPRDEETYKMGLLGFSNTYNISSQTFLESSVSHSITKYDYFYETLNVSDDQQSANIFVNDVENYKNTALKFAATLNTKFNSRHSSKFGALYTHFGYNLNSLGYSDDETLTYQSNDKGSMGMFQSFYNHKLNLSNQLTITGGFHYLRLDLNGQDSFEPRLGLKWQFASDQALSFGFGVHSRREETSLYLTQLSNNLGSLTRPNSNLDLAKALHYVIGYDRNIGKDFHLKVEAYYQDLFDIPVSSDPISDYSSLNQEDAFQRLSLINEGTGRNYGLELTFEKFLSKGYFFLLTGSLYESKYTTLAGIEYDTRYSSKYNTNLVAGREIELGGVGKEKVLNLGIEAVFSGGPRVREIDLTESINQGRTVYVPSSPFSRQLKDYTRFDFQVAFKVNKRKLTHEIRLDVQNVTSRSNVIFESYDPSTQQIISTGFSGEIIPVLSYKVIF